MIRRLFALAFLLTAVCAARAYACAPPVAGVSHAVAGLSGDCAQHAKQATPAHVTVPDRRTVGNDDEDSAASGGASKSPWSTVATIHRRGPPDGVRVDAREPIFTVRSAAPLAPSSHRPPPLH